MLTFIKSDWIILGFLVTFFDAFQLHQGGISDYVL